MVAIQRSNLLRDWLLNDSHFLAVERKGLGLIHQTGVPCLRGLQCTIQTYYLKRAHASLTTAHPFA